MSTVDIDKLRKDLVDASAAAKAAAGGVEDFPGTCNMDYVLVPVGVGKTIPRKTAAAVKLFEKNGGYYSPWPQKERHFAINYGGWGQANKRVVATEAAKDLLVSRGWTCRVRHIMD